MHAGGRLHYMDNLRALAMLAGVVFHAALAYSPMARAVFPTADRVGSALVDVFAWFLHLFRMPLFFVVAGFFAAKLVQKRGMGGMFRNRLLRIGLPFLLAWPVVHWALSASTLHAAGTALHPSPLLQMIRGLMQAPGGLPAHPPGMAHLWFLYYLLLFYVLAWAGRTLGMGTLATRAAALHPAWQLALWPLLLVPALATVGAPHPAPDGLLPQFWAIAFLGPFFAFGWMLHAQPQLLQRLRRYVPGMAIASVIAYGLLLVLLAQRGDSEAIAAASLRIAWLEAAVSVWMSCACLCWGERWLARSRALLRWLADASYWTYIVHLPVLFAVQYRLMDLDLAWQGKFAISVAVTLLACLGSYQLLVRPTPLARIFGSPTPPPPIPGVA